MPDMFWVRCKNCDVVTKSYTTREKAINEWNTRTPDWIPVEERLPEGGKEFKMAVVLAFIIGAGVGAFGVTYWALTAPGRKEDEE